MAKKLTSEQQAIISSSDAGLHATTIALADRLLKSEPDNLRALIDVGHANWQLARYDAAESALQHAIEVCDEDKRDVIFGELGNLNRARGDFQAATQWFEKQIATDPTDATGHLFLGSLQLRQGDLDSAQRTLQQGLECELGCLDEVHLALGIVLAAKQDFGAAIAQFKKALEIDPNNAAAKTGLKDVKSAMNL